ncbi:MAG: alkylhydroperoxidase/carboxymuconolactone decarboxylase family protein YurZ [Planctomycetota bacterium]|jgi:alkylhydroperoxidase/carboxymuconolactone decarboxylase family protein YurZ
MALTQVDRTLIRLSTAIVLGEWDEVRRLRREECEQGPNRAWRECVLQTHLFAGFPRLVQAFSVLEEVGGLGEVQANELEGSLKSEEERGSELFSRIYADQADGLREKLGSYHEDFGNWILEHAYARVLARPGLPADRRELLAACALAALDQDRQLASHARGSLRCGATFEELTAAFDCVQDLIGSERCTRAKRIAERFRATQN